MNDDRQSGDRPPAGVAQRLAEPPSARYSGPGPAEAGPGESPSRSGARPAIQAVAIAVGGALLLFLVSGILATMVGLLFIAAVMGAGIGLTLAGLAGLAVAAPTGPAGVAEPFGRSTVLRAAVALAVVAVIVAAVATWLFARSEGGALGFVDYLWSTFGLLVPAEILVAALGAAWGTGAGPIRNG